MFDRRFDQMWAWSVAIAGLNKQELDCPPTRCKSMLEGDTCAVADGVGGWRKQGIDPSAFPRSLMDQVITSAPSSTAGLPAPAMEVLRLAFENLVSSYHRGDEEPFGSSTICVAVLDRQTGRLDVANLGDSGAMLYRKGHLQMMSRRKQSRFNAPLQLSLSPSGRPKGDPANADHQQIHVHEGDCLIVATDGLYDNLFIDQVEDVVRQYTTNNDGRVDEEGIALDLVEMARQRMLKDEETPFSVAAEHAGIWHPGGKMDDITVLVARLHRIDYQNL